MEIRASQLSDANRQDLPNSPPDRLSSINTTDLQSSSPTLSPQNSLTQPKSNLINSSAQNKTLPNETLQKLTSNPALYNALCGLFQAKKKSFQNVGQSSFPQLQQLQQLSQQLSQQTSTSSIYNTSQTGTNQINMMDQPYQQKINDILIPSSPEDFRNGSPAPSGRKSPSFATSTINGKINQVKQNKISKKTEKTQKMKKIKNKNSNIPSSHQDSRFSHHQKIIFTPTYEQINNNTNEYFDIRQNDEFSYFLNSNQNLNKEKENGIPKFNFVEAHKRLEIFEDRIIDGKTKYVHPACSVRLEQEETEKSKLENIPIKFTDKENLLSQQYEHEDINSACLVNQKIPLFWEKRSWDQPENQMDADENEALKTRIIDFTESVFMRQSLHAKRRIKHSHRHHNHCTRNREDITTKSEEKENDDEYSDEYDYGYDEYYDEFDSEDANSNSNFDSTDESDNNVIDSDDDDKSGSYHYHISGANSSSAIKKQNRRKLQRTRSSPLSSNFQIHNSNNNRISTRKRINKKNSGNNNFIEDTHTYSEVNRNNESSNKKSQTHFGRQLKKSSQRQYTLAHSNNKIKVPKPNPNSTIMYVSNLFYETDDSCDETDGEMF